MPKPRTDLVDYGPRNAKPASRMPSPIYCKAFWDPREKKFWYYKRDLADTAPPFYFQRKPKKDYL